ncbi:MAG: hypothetical protein BHW44_00845 [Roseburia sp. 40_7]|nr:MAG: hypothetical protein BHW44_00845 [Roseburia sp. 40_7]
MTENEAIERIKTGICCEKGTVRYCTDACMYGKEKCAYSVAIKALKEIQQYRELEKRLTGMFSGELSLETVVDELERQLKEPNNPHPINAKILTYEDAAAWDAYHAIGTPEECQAAMEKQTAKRPRIMGNAMICPSCPRCFKNASPTYCPSCGQWIDWGE